MDPLVSNVMHKFPTIAVLACPTDYPNMCDSGGLCSSWEFEPDSALLLATLEAAGMIYDHAEHKNCNGEALFRGACCPPTNQSSRFTSHPLQATYNNPSMKGFYLPVPYLNLYLKSYL